MYFIDTVGRTFVAAVCPRRKSGSDRRQNDSSNNGISAALPCCCCCLLLFLFRRRRTGRARSQPGRLLFCSLCLCGCCAANRSACLADQPASACGCASACGPSPLPLISRLAPHMKATRQTPPSRARSALIAHRRLDSV